MGEEMDGRMREGGERREVEGSLVLEDGYR